jgi:hypothetical protein
MMSRTQITLSAEKHRLARRRAADLGISLAEYIRRLVDDDLSSAIPPKADISVIFGLGDSGGSDVANHKDEYVGEAIAALHSRR